MSEPDFEKEVLDASRTMASTLAETDVLLDHLRAVKTLLFGSPEPPSEPSIIYFDPAGVIHLRPVGSSLVFGRSPGCDVCFAGHREISQRHFSIVPWQPDFVLRDLGSTNGTFVNGDKLRIDQHILRDGDLIRVAAFQFAFVRAQLAAPL